MSSDAVTRKTFLLVSFVAIGLAVLILAPQSIRLFAALLALPIEALILTSLFEGTPRRSQQA